MPPIRTKDIISRATTKSKLPTISISKAKNAAPKVPKGFIAKKNAVKALKSSNFGSSKNDENQPLPVAKLRRSNFCNVPKHVPITPHKTRSGMQYKRLSTIFQSKLFPIHQSLATPITKLQVPKISSSQVLAEQKRRRSSILRTSNSGTPTIPSTPTSVFKNFLVLSTPTDGPFVTQDEINRSIELCPNLLDIAPPEMLVNFDDTVMSLDENTDPKNDNKVTESPKTVANQDAESKPLVPAILPTLPVIQFDDILDDDTLDCSGSICGTPITKPKDSGKIFNDKKDRKINFEEETASENACKDESVASEPSIIELSFKSTKNMDAVDSTNLNVPNKTVGPKAIESLPAVIKLSSIEPLEANNSKSEPLNPLPTIPEDSTSESPSTSSAEFITKRKSRRSGIFTSIPNNDSKEPSTNRKPRRNSIYPRNLIKNIKNDRELNDSNNESTLGESSVTENDTKTQDLEPEIMAPSPKKRGRRPKAKKSPKKIEEGLEASKDTVKPSVVSPIKCEYEYIDGKVYTTLKFPKNVKKKRGISATIEVNPTLLLEPKNSILKNTDANDKENQKHFHWADSVADNNLVEIKELADEGSYSLRDSTKKKQFFKPDIDES